MAASIFGEARTQGASALLTIKAGKMQLSGSTVTPDPRKGVVTIRKSEDGLMHFAWKDRTTNNVEDDLIIFHGDAQLKHVPQCKDGFVMLLEFTTSRRLFFWSQEPRKKGSSWDDVSKEQDLMRKANDALNGNTPAPASAPTALGFGGMTHSELMAMLSGGAASLAAPAAAAPAPAAAPTTAPEATVVASETSHDAVAPSAAPVASEDDHGPAAPAPAAPAAFSATDISNILGNILPATSQPVPPPARAVAPAGFSAESISNILSSVASSQAGVTLNSVLAPESTTPLVDSSMEQRLMEHLPDGADPAETVADTLSTPQLQQAASPAAAAPADAMDTEPTDAEQPEKMEE